MTASRVFKAATIGISFFLLSCGDSIKPSNTTVEGVVQKVTKKRSSCLKIVSMFGGCSGEYYRFEIRSDTSGTWSESVGGSRIDEDDVRKVIDERITFRCYRNPEDKTPGCSRGLTSLVWNGREMMRPAE